MVLRGRVFARKRLPPKKNIAGYQAPVTEAVVVTNELLPFVAPPVAIRSQPVVLSGPPTPATAVWVDEVGTLPPAVSVDEEPQVLPFISGKADAAQPGTASEPAAILATPEIRGAAQVETADLFDAAGNLRLPPPQREFHPLAPSEHVGPSPAIPEAVPAETPVPPSARTQRLAQVNALSMTGVVRTATWPIRALYWPFRLQTLKRQQRMLQSRYNQRPTEAVFRPGEAAADDLQTSDPLPHSGLARWSLQFITACVVLLLPLQIAVYYQEVSDVRDRLMGYSAAALNALWSGKEHLREFRLAAAADAFQRAEREFQSARGEYEGLDFFTRALLQIVPQGRRTLTAGLSLLSAGEQLAQMGQRFSSSMAAVDQHNGWSDWPSALDAIANLNTNLALALPTIAQARSVLDEVGVDTLGLGTRDEFLRAVHALPELESTLLDTAAITRSVLRLLGSDQWQRYLLLFQNNTELRATGGFVGSFALMDVEDGRIINLEIPGGGTYDLQGQLMALVRSPQPLHLINPRWEFHDANWWPDFPTSARKAAWFIEQSRGGSVDGVIGVTNTLLERILEVVGPIPMPEYGRTITAENFTAETQQIVEVEYDRTLNQPKLFVGQLAPKILERIQQITPEERQRLLTVLYAAVKERHLIVYSTDEQAQQIMDDLGWTGRMVPSGLSDYLMVVNTNIAGGKTDRAVQTSLRHDVMVGADGQLVVTLTVTRTHQGDRSDPFSGVQNNSWVRVYVPRGSELLTAEGFAVPEGAVFEPDEPGFSEDADFAAVESPHRRDPLSGVETYEEMGKTVFAHWLALKPGEQKSATLVYRLPFTLAQANYAYTLLAQKQPGTLGDELLSILRLGDSQTVRTTYPAAGERLSQQGSVLQYHDRLVTDAFWGTTIGVAP